MARSRPHRITLAFLRGVVYVVAAVLILVGLSIAAVETGWVKNQIRRLVVRQANSYLTATLEIGRLEGSLLRGLTLGDIRLIQNGTPIVTVDEISLSYSIRELFEPGVIIRRIVLVRPHVVAARLADGRWNMSALVKRESREQQRTGPGRPLHVRSVEVTDGNVEMHDVLSFGAVHVPSRYGNLNALFTFDYEPVNWMLNLSNVSWAGGESDITMRQLSGRFGSGDEGWWFDHLKVESSQSSFVVDGRVHRGTAPTTLDLHVLADRFVFPEWAPVLDAFRKIAIDSRFNLQLNGPLPRLATDLDLSSSGGGIKGTFVVNTTVPGWHGAGAADVDRVNIARWLSRPDRVSNITGHVRFDLDLDLGRKFPRGSYDFDGSYAEYLGYKANNLRARGTITSNTTLIDTAAGTAYGSALRISAGSIGIDAPFPYHFQGGVTGLDLRNLPPSVPLTHVESLVALEDFDVTGQFASPYITGTARFGDTVYLDARIASGALGSIDTSTVPVHYTGEGNVSALNIHRFGEGLDVKWMLDPRWAGVLAGRFHVDGVGTDGATMTVDGGGQLARADMFDGRLLDANISLHIADGSLSGTYEGGLQNVNPAVAFADPRWKASLTGSGQARFSVRDLLLRVTELDDYQVDGQLDAQTSTIRDFAIDRGSIAGTLTGSTLDVRSLRVTSPTLEGDGAGTVEFDGDRSSDFGYNVARAELSLANDLAGRHLMGTLVTSGRLTGPLDAIRLVGDATISHLDADGITALGAHGQYEATGPWEDPSQTTADVSGAATFVEAFGRQVSEATGTVRYADHRLDVDAHAPNLAVVTSLALHPGASAFDITSLSVSPGPSTWHLVAAAQPAVVSWDDKSIQISPLTLSQGTAGTELATVSGTWRDDGQGAVKLSADRVRLETLFGETAVPPRYGGLINVNATLTGTRDHPRLTAELAVTEGRVRKLSYERLAGNVSYLDDAFQVDLRLDQSAATWLEAHGRVPLGLYDKTLTDGPLDLAVSSSAIDLGLLEGVTDVLRDMTGQATVNVKATGSGRTPHLDGSVDISGAGFLVSSTGARYKNGRAALAIATDRIDVSAFHLEDRNGRALDLTGTMGTREMNVGDLQVKAVARRFEVLHNEYGSMDVDSDLDIRGTFDAPRVTGDVSILSGELKIDEIINRSLFQPYSTEAAQAPLAEVDAIAALNPWERLALDIAVHSPGTLRMTGDNIQVTEGTPIGLGRFNLRATGDLYLYKDRSQPLYVTGSLDSISGSYAFQGRPFQIDPTSSVNFHGDLNPEIYVTVARVISSVEVRVTIAGELRSPELRLASTPSLESSDILSLIVFNVSTNELNANQQQELAVRAGTLAYGFMATPLVAALQRTLGLETLEITPPEVAGQGPRVTVGNELVPGLVAQFTRQFGQDPYDQATIEYYLSRIFRIRATFADAASIIQASPFRRTERAGIDFLIFFSF